MSKLLKLKRWVSLENAANYLSTVFEESVSVRDLYAIALEGNLTLSLAMANLIANPIRVLASERERDAAIEIDKAHRLLVSRVGSNAVYDPAVAYDGFFDMPMLGGEIEMIRFEVLNTKAEPYYAIPFDDVILQAEDGELLRPVDWLYVGTQKSEIPWSQIPEDARIGVRVSELDRLVRSLMSDGDGSASPPTSEVTVERADHQTDRSSSASAPPYMDHHHPRFAPKLAAAVSAWLAVESDGGRGAIEPLRRWLTTNARELGLTKRNGTINTLGIEECAKVANWRTGGGAPRTPKGSNDQ